MKKGMNAFMRVIAGSARRLQLKTPKGTKTRPTTDRLKETLFNMLQPKIVQCDFLDLFSGSGAIGIEALSRGANLSVFVEQEREALECIQENLKVTGLSDKAVVMRSDVFYALQQLEQKGQHFDIIFMDPPYGQEHERRVLEYLSESILADSDTLIIFESSLDTELSYIENMNYKIDKIKQYKTNQHVFLSKR